MLRIALIALVVIIAVLFGLTLLPQQLRAIPDTTIHLQNAELTLYPQEDPEAVWFFASNDVAYEPAIRETTLNNIEDGKRTVGQEVDFTLEADEITISSDDNLRGDQIFVHLIEEAYDLDMSAKNSRQVLINQRSGKFEIPRVEIKGDGEEYIRENMFISFDLEEFTAGGEGTVGFDRLELEDRNED